MFLPTTREEIEKLKWDKPDIILVTGDTYIDSPHMGIAVIGKYLTKHGYKVAVIAQPQIDSDADITRLGEPRLFWGVTAGSIDSMVANYTPVKKYRNQDDYTPGGINTRPDRASIAYTNLIRRYFKETRPIVLGGLEASLRRITHYDYWDNAVRRSIIFDAKADILIYGMAEKTTLELANALNTGDDYKNIKGLCYIDSIPAEKYIPLPSFESASTNKEVFWDMFKTFMDNSENIYSGFTQKHGDRYLIHNPQNTPLTQNDLDEVYGMDFARDVHPYYKAKGEVRALETIKQSITTHRGCFGQCSFCAIAVHQGRRIISRSQKSIIREAQKLSAVKGFNGIIYDVGGATANMYSCICKNDYPGCKDKNCLYPSICENLRFGHKAQMDLLKELLKVPGIKRVFISTGIRHDMVVNDFGFGKAYVDALVENHVSGQIKLAPEHYDNDVLKLMKKPSIKPLMRFKEMFETSARQNNKQYFMTYYLLAAHPGCRPEHMLKLKDFLKTGLKTIPEQVQIFTPTPSTWSTAMYWCERDFEGNKIFVEKDVYGKQQQKDILHRQESTFRKHNPAKHSFTRRPKRLIFKRH